MILLDIQVINNVILTIIVTVLLVLIGVYLPFLNLIAPVPLIILTAKRGSKFSLIAALVSAVLLWMVAGSLIALIFIIITGFLGISIGAAFEDGFSPKHTMIVGTIVNFISIVLLLVILIYIFNIDLMQDITEEISINSKEILDSIVSEGENSEELTNNINAIVSEAVLFMQNFIRVTYPSFILCVSIINSTIVYYFSVLLLNSFGEEYKQAFSFRRLKFSKLLAVIYVINLFFLEYIIAKNLFILGSFLILIEGLAVIYYFVKEKINKNSILILIILLFFTPILNYLLLFIGFLDIWINFRKLDKR